MILIFMGIALTLLACRKDDDDEPVDIGFKLSSSEIAPDSLLPVDYTCDGESVSLPLSWSGYPENTAYFAIIMHHEASPTDIHWYWVLYDIPSTVTSFAKNETGIGTFGTNGVNGRTEYAPPCSKGPGRKDYIITVYALSEKVALDVAPEEVNREVLLDAIEDITLASASMTVWYSREFK